MQVLVDTNLLTRAAQRSHPLFQEAVDAVAVVRAMGNEPVVATQSLYEFYVVATRPVNQNGLGLTPTDALSELGRIKQLFEVIAESPEIYPQWESLVGQHSVSGKPAHDARLIALMLTRGIAELLTFNDRDFIRYQMIRVQTPKDVLSRRSTSDSAGQ